MEPLRTFEGDDLSEVLVAVHRELGPDAEIVSANRCRTGGVAGFFAKEQFVVEARPMHRRPDSMSGAVRALPADARAGWPVAGGAGDELLGGLLSMADDRSVDEEATARGRLARLLAAAGEVHDWSSSIEAAVEPAEVPEPAKTALPKRRSTGDPGAPAYTSIFDRAIDLTDSLDITDARSRSGEPLVAKPTKILRPAPAPATAASTTPAPSAGAPRKKPGLFPRRMDAESPAVASAPQPARPRAVQEVDARTPMPQAAGAAPVLRPAVIEAPAAAPSRSATRAAVLDREGPSLAALGVPAHLLTNDASFRTLSERFEVLPHPTVDLRNGVVAVVGVIQHARQLASFLSPDSSVASRECPPDVSPWLWMGTVAEATTRRGRWGHRERSLVIAVEGTPAMSVRPFTMAMLTAIRPSALRVIVDAAWSLDAIAHWLDELGQFGVGIEIDLVGVDASAEPAAILQLGIPVVTIDGRQATADTWASMLVQRLGE